MRKPVAKNDSTMEVSTSQLVPDDAPPRRPGPPQNIPQNDRSVWAQAVVGTSDFSPAATRPQRTTRRWVILGIAIIALAVVGYVAYRALATDDTPTESTPPPAPAKPDPKPAVAVPPADAAEVAVPADAAPAEAPADAAEAEAIDAAVPIAKPPPPKKKLPPKKATPKKKPAAKR